MAMTEMNYMSGGGGGVGIADFLLRNPNAYGVDSTIALPKELFGSISKVTAKIGSGTASVYSETPSSGTTSTAVTLTNNAETDISSIISDAHTHMTFRVQGANASSEFTFS